MCVIVDTNIAPLVLLVNGQNDYEPIRNALKNGKARLVAGGRLRRELGRSREILRKFLEYERSGKARLIPDSEVDREERNVVAEGTCRSDDQHIIALARVSGARLLCSDDGNLQADFGDRNILEPKGNVYKYRKHAHLIGRHCVLLNVEQA